MAVDQTKTQNKNEIGSEKEPEQKIKAVVLLSGGLDSAIAAKLVQEQGIEVYGLNFHSPFCICNSKNHSYECGAVFFAQKIGIPVKMIAKGDDYLQIVKKPRFGYGRGVNPCIDCRIHILLMAKEYAKEIGAAFIITGEVLGQRPKSQTMKALEIIEREARLEHQILRPLSAKLFPPTKIEEAGIVDRERLFDIQGRRRNIQLELGKKFELIRQYCASGGCLLTDPNFGLRLKDYFANTSEPRMRDMKFLKIGRHYRVGKVKIIIGKKKEDNEALAQWAQDNDITIEIADVKGPITLIQQISPETQSQYQNQLDYAAQLTLFYSDSDRETETVILRRKGQIISQYQITRDASLNEKTHKL